MAFASVISLKHTIEHLVNSPHISLLPPSAELIEFAYRQAQSLGAVLKRLDGSSKSSSRKRVNALDGYIREAVSKLEDVIDSHLSNQFLSQSEESISGDGIRFVIDLKDLKQDIHSFVDAVKKLEEEYVNELDNPSPEDEDAYASRIDSGGNKSKMVGLSDQLREMKDKLTRYRPFAFNVVSLVGMAGIGKTTLTRELFEDSDILSRFPCRAWVTVGRKYKLEEIPRTILAQVKPDPVEVLTEGDNEEIGQRLTKSLKGRRYLIVLDDVWDIQVWRELRSLFPDDNNGSRLLITTRLQEVARDPPLPIFGMSKMRLLDKKESWDLFRYKVFAEELCPPQLEKAGKKIAENCDGLPLTVVTVADLLSKAEKTPEYWNKVYKEQNSIFVEAYDKISEVLISSYEYLPQHLKACFLYMGVFPKKYEIPRSKLIMMWVVEGLLEPNNLPTSQYHAVECLQELVSHSVVIVYQKRTIPPLTSLDKIKTCGLQSSLWHLCNREAGKNKFFHAIKGRADGLAEGIKNQRRLCMHNNVLFSIQDVYNSMVDDCASTTRSLLCYGPYHQYAVPILGLRLLRVLDALNIRFYEFPMAVLKLVQLKYLALTYNGKLPASISKLWKLQYLIVRRHLSIKSNGAPSYLPMEIWDMKELKHLQIVGSDLLDPCGSLLPNLIRLLDVSAHSCIKGVLEKISNLEKLGIRIELAPEGAEPLCCFDHISHLSKLRSLKCEIVNPEFRFELVPPPVSLSKLPSSLRHLHLSGMGYPWEYMSILASLPNLSVLKLRCYAFRGPKWEIKEKGFMNLSFLLIEDTDLVQWKVGRGSFRSLDHLSIKHCYKVQEIDWDFRSTFLRTIEIVDCNHLVETGLQQIAEAMSRVAYFDAPNILVYSS